MQDLFLPTLQDLVSIKLEITKYHFNYRFHTHDLGQPFSPSRCLCHGEVEEMLVGDVAMTNLSLSMNGT